MQVNVTFFRANADDVDSCAYERARFWRIGRLRGEDDEVTVGGLHEFRFQRHAQARIDDRSQEFAAARFAGAVGHARVIGEHRADSSEQRVGLVAQALDGFTRSFARDPRDTAGTLGDLAVQSERRLQRDEGKAGANPFREILVCLSRIFLRVRRGCERQLLRAAAPQIPARRLQDWGLASRRTLSLIPAATIAFVHGPVRPVVQHGSRLT